MARTKKQAVRTAFDNAEHLARQAMDSISAGRCGMGTVELLLDSASMLHTGEAEHGTAGFAADRAAQLVHGTRVMFRNGCSVYPKR